MGADEGRGGGARSGSVVGAWPCRSRRSVGSWRHCGCSAVAAGSPPPLLLLLLCRRLIKALCWHARKDRCASAADSLLCEECCTALPLRRCSDVQGSAQRSAHPPCCALRAPSVRARAARQGCWPCAARCRGQTPPSQIRCLKHGNQRVRGRKPQGMCVPGWGLCRGRAFFCPRLRSKLPSFVPL